LGRGLLIAITIACICVPARVWGQRIEPIGVLRGLGPMRDLAIQGNYAYLACDDTSLLVVDISERSSPAIVGSFDTPSGAPAIEVAGNLAYLLDFEYGLYIIDVSTPQNPAMISTFNPSRWYKGLAVRGDYAYILAESLLVIDVSVPAYPDVIAGLWEGQDNIFISGDYAYLPGGYCDLWRGCIGGMSIVNISDPYSPVVVHNYITGWNPVNDVFVIDNYAYLATGGRHIMIDFGDLRILDVSDPTVPVVVGGFTDYSYYGFTFHKVLVHERNAFIGWDINRVVDFSDTLWSSESMYIDSGSTIVNLCVDSSYYIYTVGNPSFTILRYIPTGTQLSDSAPSSFSLSQNYPNPFNARTSIRYNLPRAVNVTIDIFDITGRMVDRLILGFQEAGEHSVIWEAADVSSGVYFYRIRAGEYVSNRRCLLIK